MDFYSACTKTIKQVRTSFASLDDAAGRRTSSLIAVIGMVNNKR